MDAALLIRASRMAYRFPSNKGLLSLEDLWQLPLTSASGTSLDGLAKIVSRELREETVDSFVETKPSKHVARLEDQLEILKGVIKIRIAENEAAVLRHDKAQKRRRLVEALADKENQELSSASKEDLLKKLAELED